MKENWVYRRGDLYLANLGVPVGSKQGGVRPVVVLQNDVGNYYAPTITIAPLTSKIEKKRKQPTHFFLRKAKGLAKPSMVLAEQLDTCDKMSVANRVTYFLEDFILEDGKVGYGGAYLAGKGVVGYAVFVQIPGNLIEVAADPAVLGCQLPDSGKQLVIDRRHMDNRAYGRPPYRLPEKFGLADTIGRKPRCEVGILIFGQPGFHNAAAVGRVVFLSHGVTSFLARKGA